MNVYIIRISTQSLKESFDGNSPNIHPVYHNPVYHNQEGNLPSLSYENLYFLDLLIQNG